MTTPEFNEIILNWQRDLNAHNARVVLCIGETQNKQLAVFCSDPKADVRLIVQNLRIIADGLELELPRVKVKPRT